MKKQAVILFLSNKSLSVLLPYRSKSIYKKDGKPGVGFDIPKLIEDISEFLNLNDTKNLLIVGAGRLGQALMNYTGFENDIHKIIALDNDISKIDNVKIFDSNKLEELVENQNINVGVITVPKQAAQEMCDRLVKAGIKAIWNFAPANLKVPEGVKIKNEDLSASLTILLNSLK